jgi:hypothetical protein
VRLQPGAHVHDRGKSLLSGIFGQRLELARRLRRKTHGDALAAGSAMIADGFERSVRLAAAATLLARFARRRGNTPRLSQIRRAWPNQSCDEEPHRSAEHDRRRRPWGDLVWSVVILLLLTIVAYTALHGADVLAELDELGLVPGGY